MVVINEKENVNSEEVGKDGEGVRHKSIDPNALVKLKLLLQGAPTTSILDTSHTKLVIIMNLVAY